jgi:hypothetical protein
MNLKDKEEDSCVKHLSVYFLRTNLLPYLSNSYEPDALPDQNVPNIICKYYSDGEDMIYTLVRYGSIENWNTSKITDDRLTFCIGRLKSPYGLCSYEKDYAITHDSIIAGLKVWPASKVTYVPEFVALYEIIPYIEYLPLNNETIRVAVKDYLEGGEKKDTIIKKYGKIEDWNTSEVTDMSGLFCQYYTFNEDISKWNTSKVTNMSGMFYRAEMFDQSIGEWDTSNVTNMNSMFYRAISFNKPIGNWKVHNVDNMAVMFWDTLSFNQNIEGWNVSNVTTMKNIFYGAEGFHFENAPWYRDGDEGASEW